MLKRACNQNARELFNYWLCNIAGFNFRCMLMWRCSTMESYYRASELCDGQRPHRQWICISQIVYQSLIVQCVNSIVTDVAVTNKTWCLKYAILIRRICDYIPVQFFAVFFTYCCSCWGFAAELLAGMRYRLITARCSSRSKCGQCHINSWCRKLNTDLLATCQVYTNFLFILFSVLFHLFPV